MKKKKSNKLGNDCYINSRTEQIGSVKNKILNLKRFTMEIAFVSIFLFTLLLITKSHNEFDENGLTLNNFFAGPYCFTERPGVTCPPENRCCKRSRARSSNSTVSCVKAKDPLTHFYLFTPKNKDNPEFLQNCGGRLPSNTYFDVSLNTTVFIHGYLDGTCRTAAWREMKDQMFCRGDYNVILLDWSSENLPDAADALNANKYVGRRLGCLLCNIVKQTGVSLDQFHLVGHSMGAHISGFAGQYVKEHCGQTLRRITALDPSNFGYYGYPPDERLSIDDAKMVDAIHVDAGDCYPFHIGYKDNIGHEDFYPNGGSVQLSCYPTLIQNLLKLNIPSAILSLVPSYCFHIQALEYYKATINPCHCQIVGVECENYEAFESGSCRACNGSNCAVMGMDWENYYQPSNSTNNTGRAFYLDTTLLCPFCDNSKIKLNGFPKTAEQRDPGLHCCDNGVKS